MKMRISTLMRLLCAAAVAFDPLASAAQAWPAKPVKIVMPSTTAGSPDRVTRLVARTEAAQRSLPRARALVDQCSGDHPVPVGRGDPGAGAGAARALPVPAT